MYKNDPCHLHTSHLEGLCSFPENDEGKLFTWSRMLDVLASRPSLTSLQWQIASLKRCSKAKSTKFRQCLRFVYFTVKLVYIVLEGLGAVDYGKIWLITVSIFSQPTSLDDVIDSWLITAKLRLLLNSEWRLHLELSAESQWFWFGGNTQAEAINMTKQNWGKLSNEGQTKRRYIKKQLGCVPSGSEWRSDPCDRQAFKIQLLTGSDEDG